MPATIVERKGVVMNKYTSLFMISILFIGMTTIGFERAGAAGNITLSPTSGPPGSTVTVNGSGFPANTANIAVVFDSQFLAEVNANSNGAFTVSVTIPTSATVGSHTISANYGSGDLPKATFTVTSPQTSISLSPTSGTAGTSVTISGSNFGASKTITIKFDNNPITTSPSTVTTTSTGTFSATITIPNTASAGSHIITATDNSSPALSASATFTVGATTSGVTLSPTSGPTGTVVTVSGSNFAINTSITINFDNSPLKTVVSSNTGSFSTTITIPNNAIQGSHIVSATDGTKTESATFAVVVTAITISPTSGIAGSTVTVSGSGFTTGASVTIKFDSTTRATTPSNIVASASGSFSATITIPNTASTGNHIIEVSDTTGKTASATFNVLLSGKITLSPDTGNRGASITVTGSDFSPNSQITIKFEGTTLTTTPALVTTSASGTFTATIKIPVTPDTGPKTITATDASGRIGTATFTIAAGGVITLSPNTGTSGTEVTVTGSNFNANSKIRIEFNEILVTTRPSSVVTGDDGRFVAKFDVPAGIGVGVHLVIVTDASGRLGTATFSTEGSAAERITLSPTSASVGSIVTITGSGFAASTAVTVKLDGAAITTSPASVTTSSTGTFTATITIPSLAAGSHTVSVTVGTRTANATFTLTEGQGGSTISITPTSGTVGTAVTVTGSGFLPNKGITINLDGSLIATGVTSATGTFNALFTILATVTTGPHTIAVSDGSSTASATLSVIGAGSGIVNVSQLKVVDQTGATLSSPSMGMQILIQSDVRNNLSTDQQFSYIVQIKNSQGATIMISWMTGTLPAGKQYAVAQSWLVENTGEYTAEVFVWQSISNPVILAPMQKINFSVR